MYDHKLLDLSPDGIKDISNLLNIVFNKSDIKTTEFLDWEYNQNPVGRAVGYNAYLNGELASHYVTQPIMAKIDGKKTKGLLSLNTATHPNHRGKKLFTTLANLTYNHAKKNGYKFVIGVANANSIKGFLKYLGFHLIKPLDVKIGIGNIKISLDKFPEYERYWDKELIKWRLSNPEKNYEIMLLKDQYMILAPTQKYGIRAVIGYFPRTLFPLNFKFKTTKSINKVKIWMGVDNKLSWKNTLYFNFPDRLKPSPLNLIFKNLSDENYELVPNSIKFMSIDFDAY